MCTKIEDYDSNAIRIGSHFKNRGYPCPLIEETMVKTRRLSRLDLLSDKSKPDSNEDNLLMVSTFQKEIE
jgi:hypothetical protein